MEPAVSPVPEPDIVGRDLELGVLEGALVPGGSALVLGGKGTGKTALLRAARRTALSWGLRAPLVQLSECTEVALRNIADGLAITGDRARRGARALEAQVLRWSAENRAALFLDDGDRANAGFMRWLRRLVLETQASVVLAARTGPADPPDRLRRAVLAGSREIRLAQLPVAAARTLAIALIGNDAELIAEIVRESGRLPAAIVEMARRRRDPRYQLGGKVSWTVMLADLRVENRI